MMWHQASKSRQATATEQEFLRDNNWWDHGHGEWTCWHHPGHDIGNEPFTTDDALMYAKCKHKVHDKKFCANCGVNMRSIKAPVSYAKETGTWNN
jgi:hypothetical protein